MWDVDRARNELLMIVGSGRAGCEKWKQCNGSGSCGGDFWVYFSCAHCREEGDEVVVGEEEEEEGRNLGKPEVMKKGILNLPDRTRSLSINIIIVIIIIMSVIINIIISRFCICLLTN